MEVLLLLGILPEEEKRKTDNIFIKNNSKYSSCVHLESHRNGVHNGAKLSLYLRYYTFYII